jgi:hypothetical protein
MPKDTHDDHDKPEIDPALTDEAKSTYDALQKRGKALRADVMPHAKALLKIKMMFHNPVTDTYDDRAFGKHCQEHKIIWERNERAAMIYFAEHPTEAAYLLKNSSSTSIRLIGRQLRRQIEGEPEAEADDDDEEGEHEEGADDGAGDDEGDNEPEPLELNPLVDPWDAIYSLGCLWSSRDEYEEFVALLDPEMLELFDTVDAIKALTDIAKVLKKARHEAEATTEEEGNDDD